MQKKKSHYRKTGFFSTKGGSFLADVLVSMGILTMSITASLSLIYQSLQANQTNKNKIIAVNLARESLEAMRTIRDTNWMRYGTKKRICWNYWNNQNEDHQWDTSDELCQEGSDEFSGRSQHPIGITGEISADTVGIKSYILALDPINYNWTLVENFYTIPSDGNLNNMQPTWSNPDLISEEDETKWGTRKLTVNNGEELTSRLYIHNNTGLYTHSPLDDVNASNTPTDFYQEITIEYPLGNNGFHPDTETGLNTSQIKQRDNQILVKATIWYPSFQKKMKKITLETELTDYLERDNWND